jgi:zinc transport system ATP-binding protein
LQEVIKVESLTFRYSPEEPLIENLSFSVYEGEFFCVVGPNGAGKSTLLKLLLGFLRPKAGKVFLFGRELSQFNEWEKLGYVPQRFSVERFWTGTVEELLRKVAKKEKVGWIIAFLHLENLLKRQFVKLSGGEQQKVLLALALTKNPSLLILDEPYDRTGHTRPRTHRACAKGNFQGQDGGCSLPRPWLCYEKRQPDAVPWHS